jgi:hypothetical protein
MRIPPRARFILACCLFAGWLGYLGYLAATKSNPIVLSRPQLLVSDIDVLAELKGLDQPVVVKEVLSQRTGEKSVRAETPLTIENLSDVSLPDFKPGLYLLPLTHRQAGYFVTETPPSPGYPRDAAHDRLRIYPATDEVLRQYHDIRAAQ